LSDLLIFEFFYCYQELIKKKFSYLAVFRISGEGKGINSVGRELFSDVGAIKPHFRDRRKKNYQKLKKYFTSRFTSRGECHGTLIKSVFLCVDLCHNGGEYPWVFSVKIVSMMAFRSPNTEKSADQPVFL
jgi:hypothetical protein